MASDDESTNIKVNRVNDIASGKQSTPVSGATSAKPNKSGLQRRFKRVPLWLILLVVAIVAIGSTIYFMNRYNAAQKEVDRLSNPQEIAKQEQEQLVAAVGQLVELPQGETPTVATVSDVSKLQDQAFFASAENGDKVLIYTQAKKAVLYRPSTNKLIQIAPINLGSQNSNQNN